ncbi:M50 family metallopeptidase [Nonomuraea salmonea]|uniref:M50 family metallopeptidase n=1 Tax=Nonomuraea salmonea TaxID=46181 RepID=UPI003CD0A15A
MIVGFRMPWQVSRGLITIAHEGGHAVMALLTRRKLEGIRLHSDTSGVTLTRGRPTGPGMVLTAMAGYVAPPLLGLGAAWLTEQGHITLLIWGVLLLLVCMLLLIRNLYGALILLVTGGAVFALIMYAPRRGPAGRGPGRRLVPALRRHPADHRAAAQAAPQAGQRLRRRPARPADDPARRLLRVLLPAGGAGLHGVRCVPDEPALIPLFPTKLHSNRGRVECCQSRTHPAIGYSIRWARADSPSCTAPTRSASTGSWR